MSSQGPLIFPACDGATRLLGNDNFSTDQVTINTGVAQVLIASSVTLRSGVAIRNHNALGGPVLYIAESGAKAVPGLGWPILPQAGITATISEGVTVYASGDTGDVDVRLMLTGN